MYDVTEDIRGDVYCSLVEYAGKICPNFVLAMRDTIRLSPSGLRVLNKLQQARIKSEQTDHWPGTQLHGGRVATVNTYNATPESLEILKTVSGSLYGWRQPDLPEDLSFLRENGEPWLVTISHEGDGYISAPQSEIDELISAVPKLEYLLRRSED